MYFLFGFYFYFFPPHMFHKDCQPLQGVLKIGCNLPRNDFVWPSPVFWQNFKVIQVWVSVHPSCRALIPFRVAERREHIPGEKAVSLDRFAVNHGALKETGNQPCNWEGNEPTQVCQKKTQIKEFSEKLISISPPQNVTFWQNKAFYFPTKFQSE